MLELLLKKNLRQLFDVRGSCDVISIVSDEQAYVAEFIHHYLYLGFSNIFLGINNSSDKTEAVIKRLSANYANIFLVDVDEQFSAGRQDACYEFLFQYASRSSNSSHALFVDVDEFWVAEAFPRKVRDFLRGKKQYDCISFQWINCFDEKPFSPPLSPCKRKVNAHVKSMVAYKASPTLLRPHAPIFSEGSKVLTLLGTSTNQNQVQTGHGIEIFQRVEGKKIVDLGEPGLAWIFHRIQRSELEYSHRLFKVHANEVQSKPYFKSNRLGFRVPVIKREFEGFYRSLLPDNQVSLYQASLRAFVKKNELDVFIRNSILGMSEAVIWGKIKSIPREVLRRDRELIERIFSGTRFHRWLLNSNEGLN